MDKKAILNRKNALGRGLNALLADSSYFSGTGSSNPFREIPLHQIAVNPLQPRKYFNPEALEELSESIRMHGIIQPLTVRAISADQYQLIAGERRFQAAKKLGLETVPAYIRQANDQEVLEIALIENIQRENLNPIEIALSYQRLLSECNIKQEALGVRVGKNRTTVNNYLRLLKLPPDLQIALRDQKISMGHARAVIGLPNAALQSSILKEAIEKAWSVRKIEDRVRSYMLSNPQTHKQRSKNESMDWSATKKRVDQLKDALQSSVKIHAQDSGKGEIRISFKDEQDLYRILNILAV